MSLYLFFDVSYRFQMFGTTSLGFWLLSSTNAAWHLSCLFWSDPKKITKTLLLHLFARPAPPRIKPASEANRVMKHPDAKIVFAARCHVSNLQGQKEKYGLPMPPFWAHRPMAFGPLLITSTCARIAALHISTTLFSVQISGKTLKGVQVRYRDVPDFSVGDVPQVKEKKIERNHHWKKQGWRNYAFYRILHVCSDSGSQPGQHMAQHMQCLASDASWSSSWAAVLDKNDDPQ